MQYELPTRVHNGYVNLRFVHLTRRRRSNVERNIDKMLTTQVEIQCVNEETHAFVLRRAMRFDKNHVGRAVITPIFCLTCKGLKKISATLGIGNVTVCCSACKGSGLR